MVGQDHDGGIGKAGAEPAEAMVAWLRQPDTYTHAVDRVEFIATHISWVFLAGDFAYKLKKPVRFDFLDFSTAKRRRVACENEMRVNLRLAPDVYLDVVPISLQEDSTFKFGSAGDVVDWAVKMRRLPAERTLDELIRGGRLTPDEIADVAAQLVGFYERLTPVEIDAARYREQLAEHVRANLEELLQGSHGLEERQVRRIHSAQLELLLFESSLFDQRVGDGRIVEGHGDLRPEHIYLVDPPVVIDAIEFNAEYRRLDVADELAFLAMECEVLGAGGVGDQIIGAYSQATGDSVPEPLDAFYRCYRACVRAKVLELRIDQVDSDARRTLRSAAGRYLELADDYVRRIGRPWLIVVRGLMGTGKSTLSRRLTDSVAAELLQTDAIRREVLGASPMDATFNSGHYRAEQRAAVYNELLRRAESILSDGQSVVVDGTFLAMHTRSEAAALAERVGARFALLECRCDDAIAEQRISARMHEKSDLSEARPELYRLQREAEEADPAGMAAIVVDTEGDPDSVLKQAIQGIADLYKTDR